MKIAIKNRDLSKDSEIIKLFESLGGKNKNNYNGCNHSDYYFINDLGIISVFTESYVIKNGYTCFDSINEYMRSTIPLKLSIVTADELKAYWAPNNINYSDI